MTAPILPRLTRRRLIGRILPAASLAALDRGTWAAPATNAGDKTLDRRVARLLAPYTRANRFSGTVLVARGPKVLVRRAYGWADAEKRIQNTPETRFRIFSMSKAFTAAAVLLLQEDGRLELDAPVSRYLTGWPEPWGGVSVRHLLQHTSGIPAEQAFRWWAERQTPPFSHPELGEDLKTAHGTPPGKVVHGARYEYSNPGYVLAAEIVKAVSGKPYPAFVQERIFGPLGMTRTTAYQSDGDEKRARGYRSAGSHPLPGEQSTSYIIGAGDIVSTVDDLLKWDQALYTNKLLSLRSRKALFAPDVYVSPQSSYGLGWFIARDRTTRFISHGGGGGGFTSYIQRMPEERLTVIVLCNQASFPVGLFSEHLVGLARGNQPEPPDFPRMSPVLRRQVVGRYKQIGTDGGPPYEWQVTFGLTDEELILDYGDGRKISLLTTGPAEFELGSFPVRLVTPKQGPVEMVCTFGTQTIRARKLP